MNRPLDRVVCDEQILLCPDWLQWVGYGQPCRPFLTLEELSAPCGRLLPPTAPDPRCRPLQFNVPPESGQSHDFCFSSLTKRAPVSLIPFPCIGSQRLVRTSRVCTHRVYGSKRYRKQSRVDHPQCHHVSLRHTQQHNAQRMDASCRRPT